MSLSNDKPLETPLTALQINFAQQMLPFGYSEVTDLASGNKNLLFATQDKGPEYSELHMAAGERAILRLAQEIVQKKNVLLLIDEIEAGLHPRVQELLMLNLQRIALRNSSQVIVTSHSPVVLDSVPANGRVFLERDNKGKVTANEAYRDIVQDALYGRSRDQLNILCEDSSAENVIQGILDTVLRQMSTSRESIRIGRNAGAEEFPQHAAAFRKFGRINDFIFVLDGDKRESGLSEKIKKQAKIDVPVIFLPSDSSTEVWVWKMIQDHIASISTAVGTSCHELRDRLSRIESYYLMASDSQSEIAKNKLDMLAVDLSLTVHGICRTVSQAIASQTNSSIEPLVIELRECIEEWRSPEGRLD